MTSRLRELQLPEGGLRLESAERVEVVPQLV